MRAFLTSLFSNAKRLNGQRKLKVFSLILLLGLFSACKKNGVGLVPNGGGAPQASKFVPPAIANINEDKVPLFGNSAAIAGNVMVIGAVNNDSDRGDQERTGAAYVYRYSGSAWVLEEKLAADNGQTDDQFGAAVATDGDTIVVGASATRWDTATSTLIKYRPGKVYAFTHDGTSWNQEKLENSEGETGDGFGIAVAVSGNKVVASSYRKTHEGKVEAGKAYVYASSGGSWSITHTLTAPTVARKDLFGSSVAIDGDTIVIGARGNQRYIDGKKAFNVGLAFVFTGANWEDITTLESLTPTKNEEFGHPVDVDNDTIIVGARKTTIDGLRLAGTAHIFVDSGTNWDHQARLAANDPNAEDRFGSAVAISGNAVVVGSANQGAAVGKNSGAVYTYKRTGTTWNKVYKLTAPDAKAEDGFGSSLAISGSIIVVGAATKKDVNDRKLGAIYLYND